MNEIIQNIMLFINEHTLLLIGICVFLILVLIGYLIDNNVKSKRIRNDIKNPDQVPKNIKEEIIKEAEKKEIKKEDTKINDISTVDNNIKMDNSIKLDNNETTEVKEEIPTLDLNSTNDITNQMANDQSPNEVSNEPFPTLDLNTSNDILNIEETKSEPIAQDPDLNIMNPNNANGYSNDMKLSEILFNTQQLNTEEIKQETNNDNNIFTNNTSDITINNEVKKDDVQIQSNNSSDELDRIMRKLSAMNNNVEDDNYTNIF